MPPKPKEFPTDCFGWCAGAAGFESKKLPPLRLEKADWLVGGLVRVDGKLPRPAKASFWGDLTGGELAKLRPLNASLSPPKGLWFWRTPVGDGMPALIEPEEE